MPSSSGSSQPRGQTRISCTADRFLTPEPLGKHVGFIHVHVGFPGVTSDKEPLQTHTLEKEMATHSSILAWEIHRQRRYSPQRPTIIRHDLATKQHNAHTMLYYSVTTE